MSAEVYFYIQKRKNDDTGWENICLYTKDEYVDVMRCSEVADFVREYWNKNGINKKDVTWIAGEHNWIEGWFDMEGNEDEDLPPYYWVSLTQLKLFKHYDKFNQYDTDYEVQENKALCFSLEKEIKQYIAFAGDEFIDNDNIRIIAFISY